MTHPPITTPSASAPPSCSALLHDWIVERHLPRSAAGVGRCSRADLAAALGPGVDGTGRYSSIERAFTRYEPDGLRVRAVWGPSDLMLLVVEDLKVPAGPLVGELGEADEQWPSRTSALGWSIRDHVYARAGLTLSVGTSLDDPPLASTVLVAYLYEPTTVTDYVERLGGKDEWVRRFQR